MAQAPKPALRRLVAAATTFLPDQPIASNAFAERARRLALSSYHLTMTRSLLKLARDMEERAAAWEREEAREGVRGAG
jgi:hypothetical protein